ncbi:MAG TPA: ATP-binding cassette domain-containing protein [Pseudonocardiaceae bacterium]|nr:ATP-binding cassette domain-containing protein [Pseudonocardiaceae bacterium]
MTMSQVDPPGATPAVTTAAAQAATRSAIEIRGLRKSYGNLTVLDGIDLTIAEGSVFSLLGPNGAGKTTMVKILSTLTSADAGEVRVLGHDLRRDPDGVRSVIGVTGQFSAVDMYHNATENLQLMADLWHLPKREGRRRVAELLDLFDLAGAAHRPVMTFSGGMKRRLDLAMTLVGSPRIIFLDEPTTGLDPEGRHATWETIRGLVREHGVTILLTTQYLDEADQLADHVAVLDGGRLVAEGTADELKRRVPGGHMLLTFAGPAALDDATRALGDTVTRDGENLTLQVPSDGTALSVQTVLNQIDSHTVTNLSLHTPDLDDVFFALTGHNTTKDKP